jgi:hypothetical protein
MEGRSVLAKCTNMHTHTRTDTPRRSVWVFTQCCMCLRKINGRCFRAQTPARKTYSRNSVRVQMLCVALIHVSRLLRIISAHQHIRSGAGPRSGSSRASLPFSAHATCASCVSSAHPLAHEPGLKIISKPVSGAERSSKLSTTRNTPPARASAVRR